MPALEHFWNGWASGRDDVVLVVCGSAASWIVRKIVDNYGGLHDRLTHLVRLVPFTLGECRRFAAAKGLRLSDRQLADLYLAFGGIPFYWSLVRRGESPAQAVDRLCFGETGGLHREFGRLYASLFRRPEPYVATQIKRALGIAGVSTAVHAARIPPGPDGEPGAQIDLVLDRADGIANLCEMKYASDLFAVSSKYRSELLAKVSAYQRAFGVRKTVHVTLVTAAGLRPNENADVVQSEVRLADLFADA